jgi:UDP-glucose 4-epimerase
MSHDSGAGESVRVLVTGGAGFIGHHLVRRLLDRGDDVRVLDNFSSGFAWRLQPFADRISIIEGSVVRPADLDVAAASCEVIFHQAAVASVAQSLTEPALTNEVNVGGTIETILAAQRHGVRRVILAGSSSVYGVPAELPCRESQRADPQSPYGASKLAAEHYLHTLGTLHDVETVVLRYFNVFGPGQDPSQEYSAVVPRFATAVLAGERPTIYGSGEISRDFIYVDNVVDANLLAAQASSPTGITVNIASGSRYSLLELLAAINRTVGRTIEPRFGPGRRADIAHSQADIALAQASLGYSVRVPFEEGIAATVESYRISSTVGPRA